MSKILKFFFCSIVVTNACVKHKLQTRKTAKFYFYFAGW